MKTEPRVLVMLLYVFTAAAQRDPCRTYHLLDMHEGRRIQNYNTGLLDDVICDRAYTVSGWWYKLLYNGTNYKLPESCVDLFKCGTVAPVWMKGPHPLAYNTMQRNTLCGNFGDDECCGWSAPVTVTRCQSGHGGDFYIYQMSEPSGCPMGFCMTPSDENEHYGDRILCDRDSGCSQVMVDLPKRVGFRYTSNFTCNYVDISDPRSSTVVYTEPFGTFRTSTTMACPVPNPQDPDTIEATMYGLTIQYDHSLKPDRQMLGPVPVLVYNSSYHTCNTEGVCEKKIHHPDSEATQMLLNVTRNLTDAESHENLTDHKIPDNSENENSTISVDYEVSETTMGHKTSTPSLPTTSVAERTSETSKLDTSAPQNFKGKSGSSDEVLLETSSVTNILESTVQDQSVTAKTTTTATTTPGSDVMSTTTETIKYSESKYDAENDGDSLNPLSSTTVPPTTEQIGATMSGFESTKDSAVEDELSTSITPPDTDEVILPTSDSAMTDVKTDLPTQYTVSIILSVTVAGAFLAAVAIWCYKTHLHAKKIRPPENRPQGYNNPIYQVQQNTNGSVVHPSPTHGTNQAAQRDSNRSDTDEFGYLIVLP